MDIQRKYLLGLGWLMVIVIIVLSLVPIAGAIPNVQGGDKIGHFVAYFALSTWFCWLYPKNPSKIFYAIGFILLGAIMEFLQGMTNYRSADLNDFHVNTIGVMVGFVFSTISLGWSLVKNTFLPKQVSS